MDLILLFIPSTAPLETRCFVPQNPIEMAPQHTHESLERFQPERMAERIHFSKWSLARLGCR